MGSRPHLDDEYRKRAGFPAYNNAHSRALWISLQKAPVHPADAVVSVSPAPASNIPAGTKDRRTQQLGS